MKKNLLPLLLLTFGLGTLQPGSAQILARAQTNPRQAAPRQSNRTLKETLRAIKEHYRVDILFFDRIVDGYSVPVEALNWEITLENNLTSVLKPFGLGFKKAKNGGYIVTGKEPVKPGNAGGTRSPETSALPPTDNRLPAETTPASALPTIQPALPTTPADVTLRGRVTDGDRAEGLPGVSVVLKGTQKGTTTDSQGDYSITVPTDPNGRYAGAGDAASRPIVLVFSFVGYQSQEVLVGDRSTLNISLVADTKSLNEVVVIGYGEQSRKTISTAISKVDGKNIAQQPVSNPGEALAALAPGVQVQSGRGGYPGEAPTIRIRGIGSLGTGSTPLYVVDGYPLQDANQFNLINPSDIESIDVLKDAASAAIYGSRAANGVIIVTTKRGKAGKTSFTFSAYTGIQQVAKRVDVLNRDEYVENAKFVSRIRKAPYPAVFDTNPGSLPDTDWQDAIFRNGKISEYQLSAQGGSDKIRYAISGAYFTQDGTVRGSSYDRYNLRFNVDANLSPKLKIGLSMAPSYSEQFRQPVAGQYNGSNENSGSRSLPSPVHSATLLPPVMPVYTATGDYAQFFDAPTNPNGSTFFPTNLFNPLAVLDLNTNRLHNYRLFGNGFLAWEPIGGLTLKTSLGSTLSLDDWYAYIPPTLANEAAPRANKTNPVFGQIFARESQRLGLDWLWENTATYAKTIGDHNFSALALYSVQKFRSKFNATEGRAGTYTTDLLRSPLASSDRVGTLNYDANAFLSFGGRVTYDYKSKYILSGALRSDASSRFGPNNRFAAFPSVSAAWRITEEPFLAGLKSTLNELKLRASYGETGNASIGSFTWANSVDSRNYSFNQVRTFGYTQNGFANLDLTWEKNRQVDIGLEAGFLNDKFSLGIDVYDRRTKGMLFQKDLPGVVGYATNYRTNLGELQNRGLEVQAGANLNVGAVKWRIDGNISANRTKVLDLGGRQSLPPQGIFGWGNTYEINVGDPLGNMYGYQVLGIFKTQEDLTAYPQNVNGDKIGNWIIKDQNGDGKVNELDRVVLGSGFPKFIYGMTHTVQYRNLDLSLILQGVQGNSIMNGNIRHPYGNAPFNSIPRFFRNMFDPENPTRETEFPAPGASGFHAGNSFTDRMIENGSFLRVRNVTLGYTLPSALLNRVKLKSARLYVTGQNLFTFTNYSWYNPEVSLNGDSVYTPGVDQGTYPAIRTYTVGLSLGF